MATIIAATAIPLIKEIFDKFIPDPTQKAQAALELAQLQQAAEFKAVDTQAAVDKSQSDVNAVEAANENLFIAGARPFILWICGIAMGYHFILQPLIAFTCAAFGHAIVLPTFDMSSLNTILMGMLGLGGMRSVEKLIPMMKK